MLKNITDPKLRETYGNILNGDFPFRVYCTDPQKLPGEKKLAHKKGALIGYMDLSMKCIDEPVANKAGIPISGIETSRDRFDGRKGFKCYCGNWSIQAKEEQPTLKAAVLPAPPSKQDLIDIHGALQKSGKALGMQFADNKIEYDGFMIEEIKL